VRSPPRLGLVVDVLGETLDPRDLLTVERRERDLLSTARVRGEGDARAIRAPARVDGLPILVAAGVQTRRGAAIRRHEVQLGVGPDALSARPEHEATPVGRPPWLDIVIGAVGDLAGPARRDLEHEELEVRTARVAGVRDARAVGRPRELGLDREAVVTGQLADRKSTRLNSSHLGISYAVFCL